MLMKTSLRSAGGAILIGAGLAAMLAMTAAAAEASVSVDPRKDEAGAALQRKALGGEQDAQEPPRAILPANIEPAVKRPTMPLNEKVRILPLTAAKVPLAAQLARPIQPSAFKIQPTPRPAAEIAAPPAAAPVVRRND
ncbi:MAG: hypothetical protein FGM27_05965 [Candidatus Omnitrophica bacterium]|nr:hypothetical protein [Candidatus Omnitrophota bacterium]